LFAVLVAYYGWLLTSGNVRKFFMETSFGLTFNSMLVHLLHGRFDVDPASVGIEGFLRDGKVYAYWGIFCSLLRLPLLLWHDAIKRDVTVLSCFAAVCVAAYFKLRSLLLAARFSPPSPGRNLILGALGAWMLFGGAQVGYLYAAIYHEVIFWAAVMASVFSYVALRGLLRREFSLAALCWMATLSGLAVLTRVSTGIGLCTALVLLLGILIREDSTRQGEAPLIARLCRAALRPRVVIPIAILCLGVAIAGLINFERWGNPLVFHDYQYYLLNRGYPDRLIRTQTYGQFNLERVPFGLIYYFFPLWVLHRPDGNLFFSEYRERLIDSAELPPASFLLTDALPILLLSLLCWRWTLQRRLKSELPERTPARSQSIAIAAGLAVPALLMLTAISMTYRYRMEFSPFFEISGLLALVYLSRDRPVRELSAGLRYSILTAVTVGVVASHLALAMYKLSPLSPGQHYLQNGIVKLYVSCLASKQRNPRSMLHSTSPFGQTRPSEVAKDSVPGCE
jgi:hypothetical protein